MLRCVFFVLMGWSLTLTGAWAQAPGFTVGGRKCVPEQGCGGDSTKFSGFGTGVTTWRWDFGDAASGAANTATTQKSAHLYQQPGLYTVTLTVTRPNRADTTVTDTVRINELPQPFEFFEGKTDTTICPGTKLLLDPYQGQQAPAGVKYLWYPNGDTTRTLLADSSGCYSVDVINAGGCKTTARINVKVCTQVPQQSAKWYFGNNAGLDFKGGEPTPIDDGKLDTPEGTSSISDQRGKLLFYTDGVLIYDRDGNLMPARPPLTQTDSLKGSGTSTQSALIVPQPSCKGCETVYYVFTTQNINDSTKLLSYSVVDMRGNQGKGEIIELNTEIVQNTTERLTSVKNPKDSTYWVISHDYGTNRFRVSQLTPNGLVQAGTYDLGLPHDTTSRGEGQIKLAPSGTKLGVVVPGPPRNYLEIFDFSDSTGVISGGVRLDLGPAPPTAYGVEFSPDGEKVYVSMKGSDSTASVIYQFDVSVMDSTAVAGSKLTIDSTTQSVYGALQYASDGRIYVAVQGSSTLAYIGNPSGTTVEDVQFQGKDGGLSLGGATSQLGLPNFVQSLIEPPTSPAITYADTCFGTPTQFSSSPICPPIEDKYEWDFGDGSTSTQQTPTHLYKAVGTYRVKLRQYNQCKDTTMFATLTIAPQPIASLGPDIVACRSSVELDLKNPVNPAEYIWLQNGRVIPTARSGKLTVTASGTYIGGVITEAGCFALDTIQVTLFPPPPLRLGPDTVLCVGSSVVIDAGNGNSFQWSNGATGQQLTVTQPGTYSVQVTTIQNGQECVNGDTIVVTARPKPNLTARLTLPSGCDTRDGALAVTATPASASYVYVWGLNGAPLPTATGNSLTNLGPGTYSLRLSGNPQACTLDTNFALNARNPSVRVAPDTIDNADCASPTGSIRLRTELGTPISYTWRNAAGTVVATTRDLSNVPPGVYAVEVADALGCRFYLDNLRLRFIQTPLTSLRDTSACVGENLVLDAGPLGTSYVWSNGATTRTITVNQAGTYRVTVTNATTGCQTIDSARVNFAPKPTLNLGPTQAFCAGTQPVQLAATPTGGAWSGPGVSPTGLFTPASSLIGPQTVTYTAGQNGCRVSATKLVNVQLTPTIDLGPDSAFCDNETYTLRAPEIQGAVYRWSTGDTGQSIQPKGTGTYSVTVALGNCRSGDTVRLRVLPSPRITLRPEVPYCVVEAGNVTLDAGGNPTYQYLWTPTGQNTRLITVNRTGEYTVRVTNPEGCVEERPTRVVDLCEPRIQVPEIFTPNADGTNDGLDVFVDHITEYELRIYNRWGEMVFRTLDINEKWDGRYKGKLFPPQSYAWTVSYRSTYFPERGVQVKRGAVLVSE
jgi:gliding motility-associated-like protein